VEAWYTRHRAELQNGPDPHLLLPTFARLDTTARKLAALFEIAANEARPVTVSVERATEALHYTDFLFERLRPRLLEGGIHGEQDKKFAAVLRVIRRQPGVGRSRLMQQANLKKHELDGIVEALAQDRQIRTEKNEGGGIAHFPAEGA
jgi:hypothetical protein